MDAKKRDTELGIAICDELGRLSQYKKLLADGALTGDEERHSILEFRVKLLDALLICLKGDEGFVITHKIIAGLPWEEVVALHKERWGKFGCSQLRLYQSLVSVRLRMARTLEDFRKKSKNLPPDFLTSEIL